MKQPKDSTKSVYSREPWYLIFKEWAFWDIFLGIALVVAIFYFGPKFSKWYGEKQEDKIWKNGKITNGILVRHGYLKGNYIKAEYEFDSKKYSFKEFSSVYKNVANGTSLLIMVDSTDPGDAFVMGINADSINIH